MLRSGNQPGPIIANNTLEDHLDAELIQLLGEVERVGIHAEGREQLGSHRDDFGIHGLEV